MELCEFEASLVYKESSRIAHAYQRNLVLNPLPPKKEKERKKKEKKSPTQSSELSEASQMDIIKSFYTQILKYRAASVATAPLAVTRHIP